MKRSRHAESKRPIRCAIYTRKSTEEGLEQEFNSLDAQRESAEAFVKSQSHEGWTCLPTHYDDGGYTGGNMDRPALRCLLTDIEADHVDCVVVYKVDRLSRSLLDFSKIIGLFEEHRVSFVSVTQQFNTTHSMGRLTLNILLSFAQFEREMISERTRDKIAAARRKGKWSGGMPVLGYTVVDTKLVVDELEADRVRQIYELCLELGSLLPVVKELNRRGWTTKRWTTKKETRRGGRPFTKNSLYQLLTNVTYVGKIRYKDEFHKGEHQATVDEDVFRRVQLMLQANGRTGGAGVRNKYGALLRGLLKCASCNCGMAHTYTNKGTRRYKYYVCHRAQKMGWDTCPSPSVPAGEIERFVIEQIRCIGRDPRLVAATLAETRQEAQEGIRGLERERTALERQRRVDEAELRQLVTEPTGERQTSRLAEVHERIEATERRFAEIGAELTCFADAMIQDADVTGALAEFEGLWSHSLAARAGTSAGALNRTGDI